MGCDGLRRDSQTDRLARECLFSQTASEEEKTRSKCDRADVLDAINMTSIWHGKGQGQGQEQEQSKELQARFAESARIMPAEFPAESRSCLCLSRGKNEGPRLSRLSVSDVYYGMFLG